MKILLIKNFVSDIDDLQKGIVSVKQHAATIGLNLEFTQVESTKQFTSFPFTNESVGSGYAVTPQEIFDEAKRLGYVFDIDSVACLIFDASRITPHPTNPMDSGVNIQMSTQWYNGYPEVFAEFLLHELCHYDAARHNIEDLTHLKYDARWNGQWNQKQNIDYYLFLLQRYINPMPTYIYFKASEVIGLKPELVQLLDKARGIAGVPFKITSGLRTVAQNAIVGGEPHSAHLRGLAADIACTNSTRQAILRGLMTCGIPVFIEDATAHIHVDIDSSIHTLGDMIVSQKE